MENRGGTLSSLPNNYEEAASILIASLGAKLKETNEFGMTPFLMFYLLPNMGSSILRFQCRLSTS
jgi:hypothetical protein